MDSNKLWTVRSAGGVQRMPNTNSGSRRGWLIWLMSTVPSPWALAMVKVVEKGQATNVLDSPLMALLHFMKALRQCPGAPDVKAGDVITTGTWTDAWPLLAGQTWESRYDSQLTGLKIKLV